MSFLDSESPKAESQGQRIVRPMLPGLSRVPDSPNSARMGDFSGATSPLLTHTLAGAGSQRLTKA